jgi:uncharacterized protein DUF5667
MSISSVLATPSERRRAREFAELLEGSRPVAGHELESLVAFAATLVPEQHTAGITPRAEFRADLRDTLVAQAAERLPETTRPAGAPDRSPARLHRTRRIVATGLLVSLVGGVGAAVASTHALPGDALYGLKRGIESAELEFAHSDLGRGRELLDQANHRLSEAEALASSEDARSPETTARLAATVSDLGAATRAGADALNASYAATGDPEPLVELQRFLADQQQRLADLSALLSPELRAKLSPLTDLVLVLQNRVESVLGGGSASSSATDATVSDPTIGSGDGAGVPGTSDGVTGSAGAGAGSGAGNGGPGAGASILPTAIPQVSLPAVTPPSVPLPSVSVPSVSLPSVPVPSVSVPSIPLPSVSVPLPTLPVHAPSPTCVAIPPLTNC